MNDKLKNIVLIVLFLAVIIGFMTANIISPDKEISFSERRKLRSSPEFSFEKLWSGQIFSEYEKYFQDQFVLRENFRTLKSFGKFYIESLKDSDGIYVINESEYKGIYKMEYPLNEKSVKNAGAKFNDIYDKYLKNTNVYYSIIPDKNYFIPESKGYLGMDYDKLKTIMKEDMKNIKYIDIFEELHLEDYFRTDLHWRQEKIINTANKLLTGMGSTSYHTTFNSNELSPFYGAYYGQSALLSEPDTLIYITNDIINEAIVYDPISKDRLSIYDTEQFGTIDSYNLFLSGPQAVLTIESPLSDSDRELYIFRDSYSSSLAPLLTETYSKITLIDLRYISSSILDNYIKFKDGSDVLFIYGIQILNQSSVLK